MAGGGTSSSKSNVEFFPGQELALGSLFRPGGLFEQVMQGKPSPGAERAQATGLQRLNRQQAQQGLTGQPIGQRAATDYLTQSTRTREQDFMETIQSLMQPAGQQSRSKSMNFSATGSG